MTVHGNIGIKVGPMRLLPLCFRLIFCFLILLLSLPAPAFAEKIQGKIMEVTDKEVKILLNSAEFFPKIGDKVTIGFEIPGEGLVEVEGEWKVSDLTEDHVVARKGAAESTGKPSVGYLAIIDSPLPLQRELLQAHLENIRHNMPTAQSGQAQAQALLAVSYKLLGDGKRAFDWYLKSANGGNFRAFGEIGRMYASAGQLEEAVYYWEAMFKRSEGYDRSVAAFELARLYENNLKDEAQAIEWYREAARRGDEISQRLLMERGLQW